jgi:hypothetical protein
MIDPASLGGISAIAVGFAFGMRHALEADHLAAVSTIIAARRSVAAAAIIGGLWGIGHAAALLAAATAIIVLEVRVAGIPARSFDALVAAMLIMLGCIGVRRVLLRCDRSHRGADAHSGDAARRAPRAATMRPLLIGLVHGLAGSAALMLVVLTTMGSALARIAFVAAFGFGAICGMIATSVAIGLPIVWTGDRFAQARTAFEIGAAFLSVACGCAIAYGL